MNDEVRFVDTNILIYAYDESEPGKRAKCRSIVEKSLTGETKIAVSNQILAELFNGLTKKIQFPLKKEEAFTIVKSFLESVNVIKTDYTHKTVSKAIETTIKKGNPFWDALIAETMLENQVFSIITENEKDFAKIEQLKATNPLKQ